MDDRIDVCAMPGLGDGSIYLLPKDIARAFAAAARAAALGQPDAAELKARALKMVADRPRECAMVSTGIPVQSGLREGGRAR